MRKKKAWFIENYVHYYHPETLREKLIFECNKDGIAHFKWDLKRWGDKQIIRQAMAPEWLHLKRAECGQHPEAQRTPVVLSDEGCTLRHSALRSCEVTPWFVNKRSNGLSDAPWTMKTTFLSNHQTFHMWTSPLVWGTRSENSSFSKWVTVGVFPDPDVLCISAVNFRWNSTLIAFCQHSLEHLCLSKAVGKDEIVPKNVNYGNLRCILNTISWCEN